MKISRLRDKLLISVVAISILVALASMIAVSLVVRQQHLDQSHALLRKAHDVINLTLAERKEAQLSASRRLATQDNFGSTIWYLGQYAQSDVKRETLLNTYQQLVSDTYNLGRSIQASKIYVYDPAGQLVAFSLHNQASEIVGYVERMRVPVLQIAVLKDGEEFGGQVMRKENSIENLKLKYAGALPKQESVHYAVIDGFLAIESRVPISGLTFNSTTGKQEIRQLGLIVVVQSLDQSFVDQLSRLTDIKFNVFTAHGFSAGNIPAYRRPDWSDVQMGADGKPPVIAFNEIVTAGAGFYQSLIPLYSGPVQVGTIVALNSKDVVQKNTWQMVRILVLIAVGCLVFIFPFAWVFSTSISRPLTTLNSIFRVVVDGKNVEAFDAELDQLKKGKQRHDELGDLTQSFIAMADSVKQKIEQISDLNASLEGKIEESTAQLRTANIEMVRLAKTDELTGLYNRRAFFEIAALAHAQAQRSGSDLSFIMLDIDFFKAVNDRYGHPVGDEVLRRVGRCLTTTARVSDTPARYGGEEFAVLAADTDVAAGLVLAERIREALHEIQLALNGETITPTVSIGVACLRNGESLEELCVRADAALYQAKENGRDRVMAAS